MVNKEFKYAYEIDLDEDSTPSKVVKLVGKNKRVLELGCGPGHMSRVLKEHFGCEVTGVEIDRAAAENAKKFCKEVKTLDLDRINLLEIFPSKAFDVILMADILEHLKYPERILDQSKRLLTDSGYLVISIPNIAHAGIIASLMAGQFPYSDIGLLDRTHLRFFTGESFRKLLEQQGLLIKKWQTHEVPVEFTEFKDAFERLPKEIRQFISLCPQSSVYQFIVSAEPQRPKTGRHPGKIKGQSHERLKNGLGAGIKEHENWFQKGYALERQVQHERGQFSLFKRLLSIINLKKSR